MKRDILIYFDIITSIKTIQEVDSLVRNLDTLALTFFKSEKISTGKALDSISADLASKIIQIFAKNNLDIDNRETISSFCKTLKDLIKKLKIIKIVLAFNPTNKAIENVHNFIKEALGIGYILNIEVSEDILGGAIVIFNGKYIDFSLKKRIEETFETKKRDVLNFVQ